MKRATLFAIATLTTLALVGLACPTPFAQAQDDESTGMGHGMMGSDSGQGMMGPRRGGMMGRGMGGMMGGGCRMMGMMMGDGGEMPMYREGRIAFLKAELAITDAQTAVWDDYAAALKKNMQGMYDMHKTMMAARTDKTPVARLDARISAMEGRVQALKGIRPALVALYDSLSDEQKKAADQLLAGMGCMM